MTKKTGSLTVAEFARMHGVAHSTVYKRLKIDYQDENGEIVKSKGDINVFLDENDVYMINPDDNKDITFNKLMYRKRNMIK